MKQKCERERMRLSSACGPLGQLDKVVINATFDDTFGG